MCEREKMEQAVWAKIIPGQLRSDPKSRVEGSSASYKGKDLVDPGARYSRYTVSTTRFIGGRARW